MLKMMRPLLHCLGLCVAIAIGSGCATSTAPADSDATHAADGTSTFSRAQPFTLDVREFLPDGSVSEWKRRREGTTPHIFQPLSISPATAVSARLAVLSVTEAALREAVEHLVRTEVEFALIVTNLIVSPELAQWFGTLGALRRLEFHRCRLDARTRQTLFAAFPGDGLIVVEIDGEPLHATPTGPSADALEAAWRTGLTIQPGSAADGDSDPTINPIPSEFPDRPNETNGHHPNGHSSHPGETGPPDTTSTDIPDQRPLISPTAAERPWFPPPSTTPPTPAMPSAEPIGHTPRETKNVSLPPSADIDIDGDESAAPSLRMPVFVAGRAGSTVGGRTAEPEIFAPADPLAWTLSDPYAESVRRLGILKWRPRPNSRIVAEQETRGPLSANQSRPGVWLDAIAPDSPAAWAGLRPGDLVVVIDDIRFSQSLHTDRDAWIFGHALAAGESAMRAGSVVGIELRILRADSVLHLQLRLTPPTPTPAPDLPTVPQTPTATEG